MSESTSLRTAKLLKSYRSRPVDFITQVIGVTPTDQQIELINAATVPDARVCVKSCTASGKTAALAWLTLYFLACYPKCKMVVTAPTAQQLHRVFRAELSLWQNSMLPLIGDFYEIMNDNVHIIGKKATQFCSFVTGSAENKESFAGLHSDKVVIMVDEASALNDEIFQTLYGTLSSGDTAFILVSNPVRAAGAFFDLFQGDESNWTRLTFDSFHSPNVDLDWIQEIKDYYGEDSDFYKMRVLGEFPVLDSAQFIPTDFVDGAISNILMPNEYHHFPRVLGCDVARFGDDSSVILDRQGPKIHQILSFKNLDTVDFTQKILEIYRTSQYQAVYVDGIGVGAGVVDQLKRFQIPVVDVVVSQKSTDPKTYLNLRAQTYGKMKDWLPGSDIPNDLALRTDLVGINYSFNNKLQLFLESKKDIKRRGMKSPDRADALALTFANDVYQSGMYHVTKRVVRPSTYLWA